MKTAKKTNNSGFTLVELIVVMALLAIIMGAILNFIQPTAKLYATTNAYLNQEEAVSSVYNVLNDDLTYATDVYVYVANDGDAFSVDAAAAAVKQEIIDLGESPVQFRNCLVLDNKTIRDATSKAKAKHSTGSVYKYALTDPTNLKYTDVTSDPSLTSGENLYVNYFALENLAFMDDYKFFFTVNAPLSGEEQVLTLRTEVYAPTYDDEDNKYVFNDHYFSSDNAIEFVNINSGAATSNCRLTTSGNNSPYIYIFYNRRNKIPETTVNVNYECYILDATGSEYQNSYNFTAPSGSDITQQIIENSESKNIIEPVSDTHVYYRTGLYSTTPNDLYVDGKVYFDLTSASGSGTVKLYAVYKKELKASVQYTINIYNDSDKTALINTYNKSHGDSINISLSATPPGYAGGYYAICGSEIEADLTNIKNDMDIYPYYYKNYSVKFQLQDGTPFKGGAFDIDEVQQNTAIGMPEGLLDPVIDEVNSIQYSYELVSDDVFLHPITGHTAIIIKETAVSIESSSDLVGSVNRSWNNDHFVIHMENKTANTLRNATITIEFASDATGAYISGDDKSFKIQSVSGNKVVVKLAGANNIGWNVSIPANGTYSGEGLTIAVPSANSIVDIKCRID